MRARRNTMGPAMFPVYRLLLLPAVLTVMAANVLARLDLRPGPAVQLGLWLADVACLGLGTQARPRRTECAGRGGASYAAVPCHNRVGELAAGRRVAPRAGRARALPGSALADQLFASTASAGHVRAA